MAAFDWYAASTEAGADELVGELVRAFPASSYRPGRPLHSYAHAAEVVRGDEVLARAMWGGVNPGAHAWGTGSHAPAFAAFMRKVFPAHAVSRVDVAVDYRARAGAQTVSKPGETFDDLSSLLRDFAAAKGLKTSLAGDWLDRRDGRTLYLGSPSSVARVRLYEKGLQLGADPTWVRCELVVRPANREARERLATAAPAECWGASAWTAQLAEQLWRAKPERVRAGTIYAPSDAARSLHWMLKQYGPTLSALADRCGGWDALGPFLRDALAAGTPADLRQAELDFGLPAARSAPPTQLELLDALLAARSGPPYPGDSAHAHAND